MVGPDRTGIALRPLRVWCGRMGRKTHENGGAYRAPALIARICHGAVPLLRNGDRPREPAVLRQGWGMEGAVVAVCARRGEHKLIRSSGGPPTIRAAAARRAEGPAVPDACVAGGGMRRGAVVRPLNRCANLDRH